MTPGRTGPVRPGDQPAARIGVLVVDDHAVVRRGIRAFLALTPDIDVLAEAADGESALAELMLLAAVGTHPSVVLMDLAMPKMDGIEATGRIKATYPDVAIVAMTSFSESERVHAALAAGASGYVLKDAEADEVATAIRAAHIGELYLDPAVARAMTRLYVAGANNASLPTLREREILALVARGLNNRDIAIRLNISERTARTHVSNLLSKLGLASRTQAALWAIKVGLVLPERDN